MTTRRTELLAVGALVLCGVLFGTSFVVVKHGLRLVDPIPYVGLRFALAAFVFWPIARPRPAGPAGDDVPVEVPGDVAVQLPEPVLDPVLLLVVLMPASASNAAC